MTPHTTENVIKLDCQLSNCGPHSKTYTVSLIFTVSGPNLVPNAARLLPPQAAGFSRSLAPVQSRQLLFKVLDYYLNCCRDFTGEDFFPSPSNSQ